MRGAARETVGDGGDDIADGWTALRNRYHECSQRARTAGDRGRDRHVAQAEGRLIVSV